MKPYPAYKDSGIEWIGEVPENWDIRKISHSFRLVGSGSTPKTDKSEYYDSGNINWIITGDLNDSILTEASKKVTQKALDDYSTLKIYPPGTLLIAMYGATIGKIAMLDIEGCTNQACCALSDSHNLINKFTFYWFIANKQNIINLSVGGGQPNISQEIIRFLRIPTPTLTEQQTIISFLDYKTSKIDTLIEKKQKQIELLKEERTAITNQAVTKGINPAVPMKDSGIEWLGEVPEHWEVKPLKNISLNEPYSFVDGPFGSNLKNEEYVDSGVPLIQLNNIGIGEHIIQNLKFISQEKADELFKHKTVPNDIVIAKMAEPVARAAKVKAEYTEYVIVADCIKFKPNNDVVNSDFFISSMNSQYIKSQAEIKSSGTTRIRIGLTDAKKLKIALPPLTEQKEIISWLNIETAKITNIIKIAEKQVTTLQEYRTALISNAVTGKIDVRNEWG